MTGKQLLDHLKELTAVQLTLPVRIETEFTTSNDTGSDEYHDIDEPVTSISWNAKAITIKAK